LQDKFMRIQKKI